MSESARATVYLHPKLYRAAKIKAAASDRSLSDVVNQALVQMLREDATDSEAFDERARQRGRPFEDVLESLKRDGLV